MRSSREHRTGNNAVFRAVALLIVVGMEGHSAPLFAGQPDRATASEYQVKAVFIHHLTRYLQWPRPEASGRFEIAILGESAIVPPLQAIAAKETIHEHRIAIREVADVESLGQPQILFIARPAAPRLSQVLKKTRGKPILTIAEEEGFAAKGIAVNFVLRGESIKFEINEGALRESAIEPGSQLLKLAVLVEGQR
jgi:YfiR/HmsC-like